MPDQKAACLNRYYEVSGKDPHGFALGYVRETDTGVFIASSIDIVRQALEHLIETNVVDPSNPFLDAGCGDGRIVALASSMGIPAWGIESDGELTALARSNVVNLRGINVIGEVPANVHHGNFTSKLTYDSLGLDFSYFRTIFNYVNGHEILGEMVARYSEPGTAYVLYAGDEDIDEFDGLVLTEALELTDNTDSATVDLEFKHAFVRIYVKQ